MQILSTSDNDLEKAAAALKSGLLVAFPTETVYGLGADAFNTSALAKVFAAKNRPRFDPLIIHIAEYDGLSRIVDTAALSENTKKLLSILSKKLWPGPLTLILPKLSIVPDLATAGLDTAAVRFPSDPVAQKIIRLSGGPIAAPSANLFGCLSPTRSEHVRDQLGERVDYIIDGGKTLVGLESTVLDLSHGNPAILRPGATPVEAIESLIGPVETQTGPAENVALLSPGQMKSHYAPHTPLVLYRQGELASVPELSGEGRLYFSEKAVGDSARVLSETGDLTEAAANLFDMLHELDSLGLELIRAEEAPAIGLGIAINDRLSRARE